MKIDAIQRGQRSVNHGFTLLEVIVSIGLISLVAYYFVNMQMENVKNQLVESIAQDVLSVSNAAINFSAFYGAWPDETNDCRGLLGELTNKGAFPEYYDFVADTAYEFGCVDTGLMGRILTLKVVFPLGGDDDYADMLRTYLPASELIASESYTFTDSSGNDLTEDRRKVKYYVALPRKSGQRYFSKQSVKSNGEFTVDKPNCISGAPNHILIPQAVCINNSQTGLGGYYFKEISNDANSWTLQLRVAAGASSLTFQPSPEYCESDEVSVGVVTFCD